MTFFICFSGHKAEVYTAKFHPSGNWLASAGMERLVYLWNVYGECENLSMMTGHSGPIIQLCFTDVSFALVDIMISKNENQFIKIRICKVKGQLIKSRLNCQFDYYLLCSLGSFNGLFTHF